MPIAANMPFICAAVASGVGPCRATRPMTFRGPVGQPPHGTHGRARRSARLGHLCAGLLSPSARPASHVLQSLPPGQRSGRCVLGDQLRWPALVPAGTQADYSGERALWQPLSDARTGGVGSRSLGRADSGLSAPAQPHFDQAARVYMGHVEARSGWWLGKRTIGRNLP